MTPGRTAVAPTNDEALESVALVLSTHSPSEMECPRSDPIELTALSLVVSITAFDTPDAPLLFVPGTPILCPRVWFSSMRGVYMAVEQSNLKI